MLAGGGWPSQAQGGGPSEIGRSLPNFVIHGRSGRVDPRIHAVTFVEGAAEQNSAPLQAL
jgi:hypothetical protein